MGRIPLTKLKSSSFHRKLAMGTWQSVGDPSVYGELEIDMSAALPFMKSYGDTHGVKITVSHLIGKALSLAMKERPEINGMIRGSRIYLRQSVDLFYQVNIPGSKGNEISGAELMGTTVRGAEILTLADIAKQLEKKADDVRQGRDKELKSSVSLFRNLPWILVRPVLNLLSFITYGLNLNFSFLGIPRDPFGSVMITNVGGFGIDRAWAPLVPYSRVPLLLTLGAIKDRAVIVNGQVVARPILPIGVTMDHRFMDGAQGAAIARRLKKVFANPQELS